MPLSSTCTIAISGHRRLNLTPSLEQGIVEAIEKIKQYAEDQQYQVISCLAEGADRLLARSLMDALSAQLIVVLPLAEEEYLRDFRTSRSVQEFNDLKNIAAQLISPARLIDRPLAYRSANHVLLEKADLVVAIWDGEPARGPGGTGEVVEMARQQSLPLVWVRSGNRSNLGESQELVSVENFQS